MSNETKIKVQNAFNAMKALGITFDMVKPALKSLIRSYNNNWELIEEENYKALADAIFEREKAEEFEKRTQATEVPPRRLRPVKRSRRRYQDGQSSSPAAPNPSGPTMQLLVPKESRVEPSTVLKTAIHPDPSDSSDRNGAIQEQNHSLEPSVSRASTRPDDELKNMWSEKMTSEDAKQLFDGATEVERRLKAESLSLSMKLNEAENKARLAYRAATSSSTIPEGLMTITEAEEASTFAYVCAMADSARLLKKANASTDLEPLRLGLQDYLDSFPLRVDIPTADLGWELVLPEGICQVKPYEGEGSAPEA